MSLDLRGADHVFHPGIDLVIRPFPILSGFLYNAFHRGVVFTGTTTHCNGPTPVRVQGARIAVFSPRNNGGIFNLLELMDAALARDAEPLVVTAFERNYGELARMIRRSNALARTTSDHTGAFRVIIPPIDKVLVVAYAKVAGELRVIAHSIVNGRKSSALYLELVRPGAADRTRVPRAIRSRMSGAR